MRGRDQTEQLPLPDDPYFVVGFAYEPDLSVPVMEQFEYRFLDESGDDVTEDLVLQQ